MRSLFLGLGLLLAVFLSPHRAEAQAIVLPCVPSGASCIPVSAANPLPITGGGGIPASCVTVNGVVFNNATACDSGFTYAGAGGAVALTGAVTSGSSTSNSYSSNGALPALTGTCAVVAGTRAGGATAGTFAVPAGNCAATTTVIIALPTATNGWHCTANDLTTDTSLFKPTAPLSATSVTFTIRIATANAADVITWGCIGF